MKPAQRLPLKTFLVRTRFFYSGRLCIPPHHPHHQVPSYRLLGLPSPKLSERVMEQHNLLPTCCSSGSPFFTPPHNASNSGAALSWKCTLQGNAIYSDRKLSGCLQPHPFPKAVQKKTPNMREVVQSQWILYFMMLLEDVGNIMTILSSPFHRGEILRKGYKTRLPGLPL